MFTFLLTNHNQNRSSSIANPQTLGWWSQYRGPHLTQGPWGRRLLPWLLLPDVRKQLEKRWSIWASECKKIQTFYLLIAEQNGNASYLPRKPNQTLLPTWNGRTLKSKFNHLPQRRKSYSRQCAIPRWGLVPTSSLCHTIRDWVSQYHSGWRPLYLLKGSSMQRKLFCDFS